jgi:hypothetical protein
MDDEIQLANSGVIAAQENHSWDAIQFGSLARLNLPFCEGSCDESKLNRPWRDFRMTAALVGVNAGGLTGLEPA